VGEVLELKKFIDRLEVIKENESKEEGKNKKRKRVKKEANKGVRGMPRLMEAMKDVVSCEKLWGDANNLRSIDVRMGQPDILKRYHPAMGGNLLN
jgi:hypothetical protein